MAGTFSSTRNDLAGKKRKEKIRIECANVGTIESVELVIRRGVFWEENYRVQDPGEPSFRNWSDWFSG